MVLLVQRFAKFYSKLENPLHRDQQTAEALLLGALQGFQSNISNYVSQLTLKSEPGSEILSLPWIQRCFQLLSMVNKAFAKLAVDVDYPMSKWKASSIEAYLKYSLNLLDLLNSISSSLSHLGQARLCLFHALSLVESSPSSAIEHLKEIKFKSSSNHLKVQENMEVYKGTSCPDKEGVINQALIELKSVGFAVCGIVLAGLCGDAKIYLNLTKMIGMFSISSLVNLDSSIRGVIMEKEVVLKEIKELNDGAASLTAAITDGKSSDAAEEMKRRLKSFEKLVDCLVKEVDGLFSEVLAERNEILDGIGFRK